MRHRPNPSGGPRLATPARQRIVADGFVLMLLAVWWLISQNVPAAVLPGPDAVAKAIWSMSNGPAFWPHIGYTTFRVVVATFLATLVGATLALLPFYLPRLHTGIYKVTQPVLNAVPSLGWAVIGAIWLGFSSTAVIVMQTAIILPFSIVVWAQGIRDMDREVLEMGNSFARSKKIAFLRVMLPLLLPHAVSALRMSLGVAWKISLVCELFGTDKGIGFLLIQAQSVSDVPMVFACCVMVILMSLATDRLILEPIASRLLRRY
jgi:NitT/TauT family transport system permease protein